MKQQIVIVGAGSHAKVVIDLIDSAEEFRIVGLTDPDNTKWGQSLLSYPVIGGDELLPGLFARGVHASCLGIGSVDSASNVNRLKLYEVVKSIGFSSPDLIHPTAIISDNTRWSSGSIVMPGAVVNTNAIIGNNVLINTGAIVEHDCYIEDHVHIGPGAQLAGGITIKQGAFIGIGATIKQGLVIGEWATVGAGSVVLENVPAKAIIAGNPARSLTIKNNHG